MQRDRGSSAARRPRVDRIPIGGYAASRVQNGRRGADTDGVPLAFDAGAAMEVFRGFLLGWLPIFLLIALLYLMWRVVAMMPRHAYLLTASPFVVSSSIHKTDVCGLAE